MLRIKLSTGAAPWVAVTSAGSVTPSFSPSRDIQGRWKRLWLLQGNTGDSDKQTKGYLPEVRWELKNIHVEPCNIRKTEPSSLPYSPTSLFSLHLLMQPHRIFLNCEISEHSDCSGWRLDKKTLVSLCYYLFAHAGEHNNICVSFPSKIDSTCSWFIENY